MIHQIRKMVGLLIVLVSGYAKEDYFQQAFNEPLVDIPKAPGTGNFNFAFRIPLLVIRFA